MRSNKATLGYFYSAFAHLDADAMCTCYAPQAQFDDELFSVRGSDEIAGMWRMACQSLQDRDRRDWKLNYRTFMLSEQIGCAHWRARYHFGPAGRQVQRRVTATFLFGPDGRIVQQHAQFDFWRWSRQALGLQGLLLGWTPFLRQQVRSRARENLTHYLASQAVRQSPNTNT